MPMCHLCRGIGESALDPCPNDPPCKTYDVCGYRVTDCRHKDGLVELPVQFGDDGLPTTMLLTSLPRSGESVRFTETYRPAMGRRAWRSAHCIGYTSDPFDDSPVYLLRED